MAQDYSSEENSCTGYGKDVALHREDRKTILEIRAGARQLRAPSLPIPAFLSRNAIVSHHLRCSDGW
jgi:hypothetical protein